MRYYLSPFHEVKRVFDKAYIEHKFTKQIYVIPQEISFKLGSTVDKLMGLNAATIALLQQNDLFEPLLGEKIIVDEHTPYSAISNFFIRPQYTYFGLPSAEIKTISNSLVIFGVPFYFGNSNINHSFSNSMIARRQGHKYNLTKSDYAESKAINGREYLFAAKNDIYDLGDLYFSEREDVSNVIKKLSNVAENIVKDNNRFIAIGGDHSVTYPLITGVRKMYDDIVCVHIDAHNDLFLSTECHFTDIAPSHSSLVAKLLHEKIEVHSLGLRNFVNVDSIDYTDQPLYSYDFSRTDGEFLKQVENLTAKLRGRKIYLTIDVDVLDTRIFKSVTDPLPDGLSIETLLSGIKKICRELDVVSLDIVEANLEADDVIEVFTFLNLLTEIIEMYHGQ